MRPNPILLAAEKGYEQGLEMTSDIYEELQVAFLLKAARHATFTSGFPARLRENVLVVMPPAAGKSYAAETFIQKCMGALPYSDPSDDGGAVPRYVQVDGASVTTESLRGGATSTGRPLVPLVLCSDIIFSTDLPTFLGTGERRSQNLGFILTMGEDGKMDVNLLKFEEMDDDTFAECAAQMKSIKGLTVILRPRRGFRLEASVPFIFCATPQEMRGGKEGLEAKAPGVLSRFTIIERQLTDAEVEAIWAAKSKLVDYTELARINLDIWNTPIRSIPFPDDQMVDLKRWYFSQGRDIAVENGVPIINVINRRHEMRMARAIVAHAIARTFSYRAHGDRSPVDVLTYNEEDVAFAKRLAGKLLAHTSERVAESDDVSAREDSTQEVGLYLAYLRKQGKWPEVVSRRAFIDFATAKGLSAGTVGNYLTKLRKAALITRRHGADDIHNDTAWLERRGFTRPVNLEQENDEPEPESEQEEETPIQE